MNSAMETMFFLMKIWFLMMNMSSRKLKQYYEELRDVNSQIEEYTTDELIQKKRDILFKIKQEIKHNR